MKTAVSADVCELDRDKIKVPLSQTMRAKILCKNLIDN